MLTERGEQEAERHFKEIFDQYKNRVYGYVFAISHSAYTAEEITQEIFIKLWLCRDLLSGIENLDGYIFTMARNKSLNYLRRANQDEKLMQELISRMKPFSTETDETIAFKEGEKLLNEALELISPQRRLVYQLSRTQGMSYDEIAQHLNLSRNTVKNHLVSALSFIRTYLGKHNEMLLLITWLIY